MALKTLQDLITASRQLANAENTDFVTDTELTQRVNEAVLELYDKIVMAFNYYYVSSATFTLTTSCNKAQLPDDFYKDIGLDLIGGNGASPQQPQTIHRFGSFVDRNNQGWKTYMIVNNALMVQPVQNATGTYKFYYTPNVTLLSALGDTIDTNLSRWYEFIVLQVAISILTKREQDTSQLVQKVVHLTHQIEIAAQNRMAEPQQIPIRDTGEPWFWNGGGWGNGGYY